MILDPTPITEADNPYADVECEGCLNGEDCYGWTTETLMCPTRRQPDRELDAYLEGVREFEDENRVGSF